MDSPVLTVGQLTCELDHYHTAKRVYFRDDAGKLHTIETLEGTMIGEENALILSGSELF